MTDKNIEMVRLMSNENPFGPSPGALDAIVKHSHNIHCYPNWVPQALKEKLADINHVSPTNISVSAGSYELINLIIRFLVSHDEEILTFDNTFMAYSYNSKRNNRQCIISKMTDATCNLNNLIPLCGDKTKAIFFANPNNPTGTIVSHYSLRMLLENIPEHILVIVDEAYFEYVTDDSYPESVELQKEFPNLIILRTFSKIYGLAGIRIGYGICKKEFVDILDKKRLLRSINSLAEQAAIAALNDDDYLKRSKEHNEKERDFLLKELTDLGLNPVPSQANFLYLPFKTDRQKNMVHKTLADHGLMVCNLEVFGHKKSLRISVGKKEANRRIIDCLNQIKL